MKLRFLGAADTVTGSKFLLANGRTRLLVDCGMFQGVKALRRRNWAPLPFPAASLDGVVLTHAHLDHSGLLPILVREGFAGPIFCTAPTRALVKILLRDAARVMEEDARYANRKGFSRHEPAKPLYTSEDVERVFSRLKSVRPGQVQRRGTFRVSFTRSGHILGAASARVEHDLGAVLFSGDLGPSDDPLIPPADDPPEANWVVVESTYGDRSRPGVDVVETMARVLREAVERGGVLLVPSFAVARAQLVVYCLREAMRRGLAPETPVYLDSPMASDVTDLYGKYGAWHKLSEDRFGTLCDNVTFTRSPQESKELNRIDGPAVIVSASGMLTGGRVLHHLKRLAPRPETTIFLPGFQAPGTRGSRLAAGADAVKLHGGYVKVRAHVEQSEAFSAHADQEGLLEWLGRLPRSPKRVFCVHGEPEASDMLRRLCRERYQYRADVPEHGEEVEL